MTAAHNGEAGAFWQELRKNLRFGGFFAAPADLPAPQC
jgi:hypothetical protein